VALVAREESFVGEQEAAVQEVLIELSDQVLGLVSWPVAEPQETKRGKIEIYASGRYLTGDLLDGTPDTIQHVDLAHLQAELAARRRVREVSDAAPIAMPIGPITPPAPWLWFTDFKQMFANWRAKVPTAKGKCRLVPIAELWLGSRDRRQHHACRPAPLGERSQ
jgi:hypothetical protein